MTTIAAILLLVETVALVSLKTTCRQERLRLATHGARRATARPDFSRVPRWMPKTASYFFIGADCPSSVHVLRLLALESLRDAPDRVNRVIVLTGGDEPRDELAATYLQDASHGIQVHRAGESARLQRFFRTELTPFFIHVEDHIITESYPLGSRHVALRAIRGGSRDGVEAFQGTGVETP
jgi:hypothetical protein